ncbi:MAG: tetratricopeptide repeat protein [Verrucomicrobiota bacterium]|nr:tetratricopeptide repeat protein [Verrucomicrobiota bacterium]
MASVNRSKRFWLFALITLLGVPSIILIVLEVGLKLSGFGYESGFFLKVKQGKQWVWRDNQEYCKRFFPAKLIRNPVPFSLPVKKAAGTYRIVLLGSSAIQGDPDSSFSVARQLEVQLGLLYPGVKFEIVNAGITAINSNVVVQVAKDAAKIQPDLFIVYEGNNEVIGPYGPGTVFTPLLQSRGMIQMQYDFRRWRIGQWVAALGEKYGAAAQAPTQWGGLEMFTAFEFSKDDPRLAMVYQHFHDNLQEIARIGNGCGASVILSTVAVNLRDFPPFLSRPDTALDTIAMAKFEASLKDAEMAIAATDWVTAETAVKSALSVAPTHAYTHYLAGKVALGRGDKEQARTAFITARDNDLLRYRTDSKLNTIITTLGNELKGQVTVVDAERELSRNSPEGIPGREFFLEHVHFTFDGNYGVARAFLPAIHADLIKRGLVKESTRPKPVSLLESKLGLAFTLYEQYAQNREVALRLMEPPFTRQPGNAASINYYKQQTIRYAQAAFDPAKQAGLRKLCETSIQLRPDDYVLKRNYSQMLAENKDTDSALKWLERALQDMPNETGLLENCVTIALDSNRLAIAGDKLAQLASLRFTTPRLSYFQGSLALKQKNLEAAEIAFRNSIAMGESIGASCIGLAQIAVNKNNLPDAEAALRNGLLAKPNEANLHYWLARVLLLGGKRAEAISSLEQAVELAPAITEYSTTLEAVQAGRPLPQSN